MGKINNKTLYSENKIVVQKIKLIILLLKHYCDREVLKPVKSADKISY